MKTAPHHPVQKGVVRALPRQNRQKILVVLQLLQHGKQNRLHAPVSGTHQDCFQLFQGLFLQLFHQIITIPEMPVKGSPVDLRQGTDLFDGDLLHRLCCRSCQKAVVMISRV